MREFPSSLLALTGSLALALTLSLGVRAGWVDRLFRGLNRVYRTHHHVAALALTLIMAHVGLETWDMGFSSEILLSYATELPLTAAWLAVGLLILVWVLAKKRFWPHRRWHRWHLLAWPAWLLASYHGLAFYTSSTSAWISWSTIFLGSLALIRTQILPRTPWWGRTYRISQLKPLNKQIYEMTLTPLTPTRRVQRFPGQYFYLRFHGESQTRDWHPFTCIAPTESETLIFAIKSLGKDTRVIGGLSEGSLVDVEGPYGQRHTRAVGPELWIVGGVGVTPLISVTREASFGSHPVRIIHAVDEKTDQIYSELWQKISLCPLAEYNLWLTSERGYISLDYLKQKLKGFEGAKIFVAGPDPFIVYIRSQLKSLKVSPKQIITEEFIK